MPFPDLPGFIWFLFTAVSTGFIYLLWRQFKNVTDDISLLRTELKLLHDLLVKNKEDFLNNCFRCGEKFRTKDEANSDWRKLTEALTEQKSLATERHRQIWEKIDNQTRLFMQEKQFLHEQIQKNGDRLTRLEIENKTK